MSEKEQHEIFMKAARWAELNNKINANQKKITDNFEQLAEIFDPKRLNNIGVDPKAPWCYECQVFMKHMNVIYIATGYSELSYTGGTGYIDQVPHYDLYQCPYCGDKQKVLY